MWGCRFVRQILEPGAIVRQSKIRMRQSLGLWVNKVWDCESGKSECVCFAVNQEELRVYINPPEPTKFPYPSGAETCVWEPSLGVSVGKTGLVLTCEWSELLSVNLGVVGRAGSVPVCARARQVGFRLWMGGGDAWSQEATLGSRRAGGAAGWAGQAGQRNTPPLRPKRCARWGLAGTGAALPPLARRLRRLLPPQSLWLGARCRLLPFPPLGKRTRGPLSRSNHGLGPQRLGQLPWRRFARVPGQARHHRPGPAAEVRRHVLQRGGRLREQDAGFRCPERGAARREDSPEQPGQRPRLGEPTWRRGGYPAPGPRPGGEPGARARVARARWGGDPERHRQGGFAKPRPQGQGKGARVSSPPVLAPFSAPGRLGPGTTFSRSLCGGDGGLGGGKGHPPPSASKPSSPNLDYSRVSPL